MTACTTIAFATINITSDTFSFYLFEVEVNQEKLIIAGQITTGIVLALFLLKVAPDIFDRLAKTTAARMEKRHAFDRQNLAYELGWSEEDRDYSGSPQDDIDDQESSHKREKLLAENFWNSVQSYSMFVISLVQDFTLPIFIGFLGVLAPEIPSRKIDQFLETAALIAPIPPVINTNDNKEQ